MKISSALLAASATAALSACGGGNGTAAPTVASYLAFVSPNTLPASTGIATANGNGGSTLVIDGKKAQLGAIDSAGNATAVSGDFNKIIAFGANSAVQLCPSPAGAGTDGAAGVKSAYSLAMANAQPASLEEIRGKSFKVYEDCAFSYDATLHADGSLTADGDTETAATVTAAFSPDGHTFSEAGVRANIKASAYRVMVNGAAYYVVVDRGNVVPYNGTIAYNALWISNP